MTLLPSFRTGALSKGGAAMGSIQIGTRGDHFLSFASRARQVNGFLDVAVHGSANSVRIGTEAVNHRVLASIIQRNPQFTGQPIRLLSCNTGSCATGLARNLSNKLGVPVIAPNNLIWATQNGRLSIGALPGVNTGRFVGFWPGL